MMMKIKPLSALCCLLSLVVLEKTACAQISHSPRKPGQEVLNDAAVKNFRYYLGFEKKQVRLKDGRFKQGSTPDDFLNVALDGYRIGDLDNNGTDDAVVVLMSNTMGSGGFFELTALIADMESDVVRQTNSVVLGDRIKVNAITIESGSIWLDLTVHQPDDPSCCPSQKIKKRFILIEDRLVEVKL